MRVRTAHFAIWSPRSAQRTSAFGNLNACTPRPGETLDRMTFGDVDCSSACQNTTGGVCSWFCGVTGCKLQGGPQFGRAVTAADIDLAGHSLGRRVSEVNQWHVVLFAILLVFVVRVRGSTVTSPVVTKTRNSACKRIQKPIDADIDLCLPAKKKKKRTFAENMEGPPQLIGKADGASTLARPLAELASAASGWSVVKGRRTNLSRPMQATTPPALIATTNRFLGLPLDVDSQPLMESRAMVDTMGLEPNTALGQPAKIKCGDLFRVSVGGTAKTLVLLVGLLGVYALSHGICTPGSPCVASAASDFMLSNDITVATSTEDVSVLPS